LLGGKSEFVFLGFDVVFERCFSGWTAMRVVLEPSASIEEKRVVSSIYTLGQKIHVLYTDIRDDIRLTVLNDNEMLAAAVATVA
jgi:hypothetical protein